MSLKEIEDEVMKLDADERVLLSEKLLGSVSPDLVYKTEWIAEINRRVAEIREGSAKLVSSEDMFRKSLESLD